MENKVKLTFEDVMASIERGPCVIENTVIPNPPNAPACQCNDFHMKGNTKMILQIHDVKMHIMPYIF